MQTRVRAASQNDLALLASLNEEVQALHVDMYPAIFKRDVVRAEVDSFFLNLISSSDHTVLIAEDDAGALGYIWSETQLRPETPFTYALPRLYIHHVVVTRARRRRGAGCVLLKAIENQASSEGIKQIIVSTWEDNTQAHAFFRSVGFLEWNQVLAKVW